MGYESLQKRQSHAFGKDVYLLGADKDGVKYWLESPSWDCGWYWGFGYIKTYTNNDNPASSKDITSHQHADNFLEWAIDWNGKERILVDTTFSKEEAWELSELFERFYILKKTAELFGRGNAHITETQRVPSIKRPELAEGINKVLIPQITKAIYVLMGS
jgi:hypothetical protein